jgi:trans-aconitate methyltransferase
MEFSTAIRLIKDGISKSVAPQRWADLGAGDGLFTQALGSVLPASSSVLAIDQNAGSLKSIAWYFKSVSLRTHNGDFTLMNWGDRLDGILMANALHYVKDQVNFLSELKNKLAVPGRVLIVEYDRRQANTWVPYPIPFKKLMELGEQSGFSSINKLEEVPSVYDGATIYSAILTT